MLVFSLQLYLKLVSIVSLLRFVIEIFFFLEFSKEILSLLMIVMSCYDIGKRVLSRREVSSTDRADSQHQVLVVNSLWPLYRESIILLCVVFFFVFFCFFCGRKAISCAVFFFPILCRSSSSTLFLVSSVKHGCKIYPPC